MKRCGNRVAATPDDRLQRGEIALTVWGCSSTTSGLDAGNGSTAFVPVPTQSLRTRKTGA